MTVADIPRTFAHDGGGRKEGLWRRAGRLAAGFAARAATHDRDGSLVAETTARGSDAVKKGMHWRQLVEHEA